VSRTGEHRNYAENDLFYTLYRAPAFGCLFIHRRVVTWSVQDGYTHIPIGVDFVYVCVCVVGDTSFDEKQHDDSYGWNWDTHCWDEIKGDQISF
jgi:hypothetical protein